jgi:predicted PurR-regulated permease PerM
MASVVVPVLLAWVVAMVLLPVVDSLERRGLSRALTSTVLVVLLIASMVVIIGVLTVPLTYWVGRTSELGALLKERLHTLGNPLTFFDEISTALSEATGKEDQSASAVNLSSSSIVTVILSVLTPLVSQSTSIYFGTLTVVNICLGIAATVMTWLVGLPHPYLWGMLAAVMNFIPLTRISLSMSFAVWRALSFWNTSSIPL